MAKKKPAKYYAVYKGRRTGIFTTWPECNISVSKYPGALFKGFPTEHEAEYFAQTGDDLNPDKFYGVVRGRVPGVYSSWAKASEQISGKPEARCRGFASIDQARMFVANMGLDEDGSGVEVFVPKSYFDRQAAVNTPAKDVKVKVEASNDLATNVTAQFEPKPERAFLDEFDALACSQGWVSGTQEYREHKNEAIKEEFTFLYLQAMKGVDVEDPEEKAGLDPEELNRRKLLCYRDLCQVLGKEEPSSIPDARMTLRAEPWVNIVDLIDARRTGATPRTWTDFEAFTRYSKVENKIFSLERAKNNEFLSTLLVNFGDPKGSLDRERKMCEEGLRFNARVRSGRITKKKRATATTATANARKIEGVLAAESLYRNNARNADQPLREGTLVNRPRTINSAVYVKVEDSLSDSSLSE